MIETPSLDLRKVNGIALSAVEVLKGVIARNAVMSWHQMSTVIAVYVFLAENI